MRTIVAVVAICPIGSNRVPKIELIRVDLPELIVATTLIVNSERIASSKFMRILESFRASTGPFVISSNIDTTAFSTSSTSGVLLCLKDLISIISLARRISFKSEKSSRVPVNSTEKFLSPYSLSNISGSFSAHSCNRCLGKSKELLLRGFFPSIVNFVESRNGL